MVERSGNDSERREGSESSSQTSQHSQIQAGIAHSKAIEDFGLLSEVIADTEGDVMDLFVMNLRILHFMKKRSQYEDTVPDDALNECMVCQRIPRVEWRLFGNSRYQRTYFHCESHAEEFHTEIKHKFICCAPAYDPNKVYPWQEQGRAI